MVNGKIVGLLRMLGYLLYHRRFRHRVRLLG